jgi:class 3 adenylate cyclase
MLKFAIRTNHLAEDAAIARPRAMPGAAIAAGTASNFCTKHWLLSSFTHQARACVRMAVAMQRQMVELQQEWRASGFEQPFEMRIGINTGYCNVGNFGSDDRMDYTIIGAEVNLAAWIEAAADPDSILISYPTYALAHDIVRAQERGSIAAKGIRREVRVVAVAGILDDHDPAPIGRE